MKAILRPALVLALLCLVVPCALADWPQSVPKWSQMQGLDPYGAASWIDEVNGAALTADDFLCTSTEPVVDIHFAGWSYYGNQYIDAFRVTFWNDVPKTPNDESHPGEQPIYDRLIGRADPLDPLKLGFQDMLDGTFRINLPEPLWFRQQGSPQQPLVYWLGIQGVFPLDDGYGDAFFWYFRDRNLDTWNDDAAFASEQFQTPPWSNWGFPTLDGGPSVYDGPFPIGWAKSADMAFTLTTPEPGTLALLAIAGLGALFAWRRKWHA